MTVAGCAECPRLPGLNSAQCAQATAMRLPADILPSPGNPVANDERAALFGHRLFFDARLSQDQRIRCATCHEPERFFTDGLPVSVGLMQVTRNSPSLLSSPFHRWQMWDGKADSMWSQPLLAFENEREMNFTRCELAHAVVALYRDRYEALFGALPDLSDPARFPARAKPGDAAWAAMSASDKTEINRIAANVGKAIEAYERKLAFRPGAFDAFLDGDDAALSPLARDGFVVFVKAGCAECHSGPLLSDDAFHAVDVPALEGQAPERGRAQGLEILAASEFNAAGAFNEGAPQPVPTPTADDEFAWRTPSLRNVARTYPYGHNGSFASLEAAVDFHLPAKVTATERTALLAFLSSLNASDPSSPWNNWPNR